LSRTRVAQPPLAVGFRISDLGDFRAMAAIPAIAFPHPAFFPLLLQTKGVPQFEACVTPG